MANLKQVVAAVAALAPGALAGLNIHNYCNVPVTVVISENAACDYGEDGQCGSTPWTLSTGAIQYFEWVQGGVSTSLKIGKTGEVGVLQFEYTYTGGGDFQGIYWDLSDLDGAGAGLVGTPFAHDNVKVSPTGKGEGEGTCKKIRCKADEVCLDSYQTPVDNDTKHCPVDTGDMWLDLCQDEVEFNRRSEVEPEVVARRHLATHRHGHAKRRL